MRNFGLFILGLLFSFNLSSQDMSEVFQSQTATWYGLDFSEAYFIGSEGFANPKDIKDRYFNSWNMLIKNEYDKYDLGKAFQKENIDFSFETVSARNNEVSIYDKVIDDGGKTMHLDDNMVQEVVGSYDFENNKEGLGIVFIVESFSKKSEMGNYFVTFFDIETKRVLLTERMSGKVGGIGLRNYWAKTYYLVLKEMPKQLKAWKKKYDK